MAADDLDDDERELIRKHREARRADEGIEYEIGSGDKYARVPARSKAGQRIGAFFREAFGIDLDDEPVQDDDEPKQGKAQQGGQVKAFRAGRRVG